MTQSSTTNSLLLGKKRCRSDDSGCISPRKKPTDSFMSSSSSSSSSVCALQFSEPQDVTELRRRIETRATNFHGLELCPWAQTSVAMLTAVEASAGTDSNHLVRWLIKVDNPHWFTVGLRTAVQRHYHHIVQDLLGHAAFWPEHLLLRSSSSSSSSTKLRRTANACVFGATRAKTSKSSTSWGPFSSDYYGLDDAADDTAASATVSECVVDDCRHAPALLMLDALLHGNQVAAELIMRTFVPAAWSLEGAWTMGRAYSEHNGRDAVPPTIVYLGKKRFHATGRVPCASVSELVDQVKNCLRACQGKMKLVEQDSPIGE